MNSTLTCRFNRVAARQMARPTGRGHRQVAKAFGDTQLVISGATATLLAVGRFVALPYQRRVSENQIPKQNGTPHAQAGDTLAEDASFIMQSNDPAGFNLVDLLAYGSLGHALGFFLLAASSLQAKPIPF